MADDKTNVAEPDRSLVSGEEDYEVQFLAEKHGITPDKVRSLIRQHGNSRDKLEAIIEDQKGR